MTERQQQKWEAAARWTGWLLMLAHFGALLFAFYGIWNAYNIVDTGDPMDTAWAVGLWRSIMYVLIAATLLSGSAFLIAHRKLQKQKRNRVRIR